MFWEEGPSLPEPRGSHQVVEHSEALVVLGWNVWLYGDPSMVRGALDGDGRVIAWTGWGETPDALDSPGAIETDGTIVMAGGFLGVPRADAVDAVWAYTGEAPPTASDWVALPSLPEPRAGLRLLRIRDHLVAVGGWAAMSVTGTDTVWIASWCQRGIGSL
jgi:hypothetical protein